MPLQSEKLYEALRGVGGTTRLVILPYEVHGYFARESVEQVLYEMVTWFDKYVKNAAPRKVEPQTGRPQITPAIVSPGPHRAATRPTGGPTPGAVAGRSRSRRPRRRA